MPRYAVRVAAFVIMQRWNKEGFYEIYLMRRAGTSHEEGRLGLPSGHHEEGETTLEAAVRELREETGVVIRAEDLQLAHTQFNKAAGEQKEDYLNLFFVLETETGVKPRITEPDKCSEANWFPQEEAVRSDEVVSYVRYALYRFFEYGERYSETMYATRA